MADSDESCDRNPSPPKELMTNADLIHADNIGDTVFSKHWLFTTLMKLIEEVDKHEEKTDEEQSEFGFDVDEDLQNELCKLWDMSMNSDVSKFLQEFKAVDILTSLIVKSRAPRVTEIVIGILGNMACNEEICKDMTRNQKFIDVALFLLENPDTETLLETTRLLFTCVSSSESRAVWTAAIKADEKTFTNIKFILSSSTNTDLLKNTGELLDKLLDVDETFCSLWGKEDLVFAIQEAMKQIGYRVCDALDTYLHIYQLLSTTQEGVAALIANCDDVFASLMRFLVNICEDEILGLEGREGSLASAISVLNVLGMVDCDKFSLVSEDHHFMRCLLKILEALYPRIEAKRKLKDQSSATQRNRDTSSNCGDGHIENGHDSKSAETNQMEYNVNNVSKSVDKTTESVPSSSQGNSNSDPLQELTFDHVTSDFLYSIIQGFLVDIVKMLQSMCLCSQEQNSDETTAPAILHYLDDDCPRGRIHTMLRTLEEAEKGQETDFIKITRDLARKYDLNRLSDIEEDDR
ncbi:protein saal1-like [Lineus longissimus]|uniref:protein saal1-like n=1 Tax=Lineus longissimus TaxID=88925 RepID=UPI002B4EF303